MINKLKTWWQNDAKKPELRSSIEYTVFGAYSLWIVYNFVDFVFLQPNPHAAVWTFNTAIWFFMFIFATKTGNLWRKLAKECLETWGVQLKGVSEVLEANEVEIKKLRTENDELRKQLPKSKGTPVSTD